MFACVLAVFPTLACSTVVLFVDRTSKKLFEFIYPVKNPASSSIITVRSSTSSSSSSNIISSQHQQQLPTRLAATGPLTVESRRFSNKNKSEAAPSARARSARVAMRSYVRIRKRFFEFPNCSLWGAPRNCLAGCHREWRGRGHFPAALRFIL